MGSQVKLREMRWVIGVAAVFWLLCCAFVLQRYYNFYPTYVSFDQGIFNQVFWNSLHGRWFQSSLSSTEASTVLLDGALPEVYYRRLGQHFTPALLLWLPFYALFPSPAGLSVLQVTLVALGGLVLYVLARHYLPNQIATLITLGYYCANAVIAPTLANFHDFSQVPLFVFGLLLAMEKRWWRLFWVLSGLTLLIREDAGVILFGVGAYLILSRRYVWKGCIVCALSLGYMLLLTNLIMPMFSPDISRRFMVEQFGQFVGGQEASTLDVLWAIARNPLILLKELVTPVDRTVSYLLAQWLPLVFVPAISLDAWFIAGFPTLKVLMQHDPNALSLHLRYAMSLVPGLFYGAILWWAKHPLQFQPRIQKLWIFCIGLALFLTITSNPNRALSIFIPDSFQPWVYTSPARQWQHAQAVRSLMSQIPPDASVTATGHLVSHLSNRREVLRFPATQLRNDARDEIQVEYAIADLWYPSQFQVAFDDDRKSLVGMTRRISRWLNQGIYGLVDFEDGVALLQLKTPSNPEALQQWEAFKQETETTGAAVGLMPTR